MKSVNCNSRMTIHADPPRTHHSSRIYLYLSRPSDGQPLSQMNILGVKFAGLGATAEQYKVLSPVALPCRKGIVNRGGKHDLTASD